MRNSVWGGSLSGLYACVPRADCPQTGARALTASLPTMDSPEGLILAMDGQSRSLKFIWAKAGNAHPCGVA